MHIRIVTATDEGSSVSAEPGDVVELRLHENPTTGFFWSFDQLPDELSIRSDTFVDEARPRDRSGAMSRPASGVHIWLVEATTPGTFNVELRNTQPWHPELPPTRRFAFEVHVAG